jgi:hypothetical protein
MYLQFDIDFNWHDFLWSDIFMTDDSLRFYQEYQQQFEMDLLNLEAIAELKAKLLSNRQDMEREMQQDE